MTSPVLPIQHNTFAAITGDSPEPSLDEGDWSEFSEYLNSPHVYTGTDSVLDILDRSKTSLQQSLELTAAQPTGKNMFEATRHLSAYDLQTLLVGKVVDKATKGIDRMLNMQ